MSAHTASLAVKVFPTGQPGKVFIEVTDTGPHPLTDTEAEDVLRMAAGLHALRRSRYGDQPDQPDDEPDDEAGDVD